ncbi:unnamed protein product [Spirodela intermedia]|uniref:Protein MAK16 homolog n=1 Tax=Spirodela intermedia TaxID=51605 RepID=A0A7I8JEW8_SPIIN|nr:unnamed protein product [Spirodela intermedia]CAA6668471.1 unnamed protein product [Spirodela intermedia]
MQHDDVIWQVIRHNHCSFMSKIVTGNFCRNPYNVTGICNRSSCPLANSRYATIRDHEGLELPFCTPPTRHAFCSPIPSVNDFMGIYLYMKTIERAHKPNDLWERVKLPRNYEKALELIDKHLQYWPKFLVHKNKQRLTKMTQYRIRMRKLVLKVREKIVTMPRKQQKREARREEKAEKAAVLEKHRKRITGTPQEGRVRDIYNYPVEAYDNILNMEEMKVADVEEEEEEEDMEDFGGFVQGDSFSDEEPDEISDDEEDPSSKRKRKDKPKGDALHSRSRRQGRVLIEVEHDDGVGERHEARH